MNIKKEALGFIALIFLLLGALFGMQIMTFIFGNLGPETSGFTPGTAAYNTSEQIQNNSLASIQDYTEQSGTQFTTAGVAITLLILLALFALFWGFFMGKKAGGSSNAGFS